MMQEAEAAGSGLRVRAFVGLALPPAVAAELAHRQAAWRQVLAGEDIGWSEPENFHITLVFLGALDGPTLGAAQAVLREVAPKLTGAPLALGVDDAFPQPLHPKVLITRVQDPAGRLDTLHRALVEAYAALGYKPNHPAFRPHVTLGHVHRGDRRPVPIVRTAGESVPWVADRLSLFIGRYTEAGLRYHPVDTRPLRCAR